MHEVFVPASVVRGGCCFDVEEEENRWVVGQPTVVLFVREDKSRRY